MMLTGRLCQIRALTQHDQMTCLGPLVEHNFQMSIKLSTFAALIKRGEKDKNRSAMYELPSGGPYRISLVTVAQS